MLELTVKTLDSQNHSFTLPDEATVLNLKESILEKMEVPIATQRLIFHGKVLHDQKKLTEYGDVNGKVIHLVQRAPPSSSRPTDNSGNRAEGGSSRSSRRLQPGHTAYLGSMADLIDVQGGLEISTRPSQAMARNRIDCANRMMGYARQSLRHIDDPPLGRTGLRDEPTASREPAPTRDRGTSTAPAASTTTSETTTFPATTSEMPGPPPEMPAPPPPEPLVPTPASSTEPAPASGEGEAASSQATPSGSRCPLVTAGIAIVRTTNDATGNIGFLGPNPDVAVEVEIESSDVLLDSRSDAEPIVRDNSGDAPPAVAAAAAAAQTPPPRRREEGARVENMVPLLQDLENLHRQLNPYLVRCRNLLSADSAFEENDTTVRDEGSRLFNGMSETLHSLAHACHALSDLMVDFEEDPPRSLRCRPVVLQHSTILETGFPIRINPQDIEAQINVRRVDVSTGTEASSGASTTGASTTGAPTTGTNTATTATASAPGSNTADTPPTPSLRASGTMFVGFGPGPGRVRSYSDSAQFELLDDARMAFGGNDDVVVMDLMDLPPMGFPPMVSTSESQPPPPAGGPATVGHPTVSGSFPTSDDPPHGAGTPETQPNTAAFQSPTADSPPRRRLPPGSIERIPVFDAIGPFHMNANGQLPFPPIGQVSSDLRAFVSIPPGGSFNLLSSVQGIAEQIHNQMMNRIRPLGQGQPADQATATTPSTPTSAATTDPQTPSSDASTPHVSTPLLVRMPAMRGNVTVLTPGRPQPTPSSGAPPSAAGADTPNLGPRPRPQGADTAPPLPANGSLDNFRIRSIHEQVLDPRGLEVPVSDMFQTLFQATFDPTLPCNSHHIRTTRQRASQTPRVRIRELGGAPLQILTRHGGGSLQMSRRSRANAQPQQQERAADPAVDIMPMLARYGGEVHVPMRRPRSNAMSVPERPDPALEIIPRWLTRLLDGAVPLSGTIAEFLELVSDEPHVEGNSIVTDLLMTLARNLTWIDVLQMSVSQGVVVENILNRIQPQLRDFVGYRLLQGQTANAETVIQACERLFNEMRPFIDAMELVRLRESIDLPATINNFNQSHLPEMMFMIIEYMDPNFGSIFLRSLTNYVHQLLTIVMHCCVDGGQGFDAIVRNCVRFLTRGVPLDIQEWTEFYSINNLHQYTSRLNIPIEDIQQYLVYRIPNAPPTDTASAPQEPMETDSTIGSPLWAPPETIPSPEKVEEPIAESLVAMDTENLPDVVIGSESWHNALPSEWVPVIARDTQRQRKQASQKPFSDAYLSGMPPKRRKIIANARPQGDVAQNITEGLQRAIQSAGVSTSGSERAVAEAGRDVALQQAYKQQEKATGSEILRADPDFKPARFPNAHKYFDK